MVSSNLIFSILLNISNLEVQEISFSAYYFKSERSSTLNVHNYLFHFQSTLNHKSGWAIWIYWFYIFSHIVWVKIFNYNNSKDLLLFGYYSSLYKSRTNVQWSHEQIFIVLNFLKSACTISLNSSICQLTTSIFHILHSWCFAI